MSRTRTLCVVFCALAILASIEDSAEAGVRGNNYQGNFTNNNGLTAVSCMSFALNGTILFDQDFGSGPIGFQGVYSEFDLFLFSFWSATLSDGSPDGQFTLSGLSLFFGTFSTMMLSNSDVGVTATGFYFNSFCQPVPPNANADSGNLGGAE